MKVYSDTEGEEMLYSVLLGEEEMMLFSELQKEFGKLDIQEAKKLGTTVSKLRQSRAGIGKSTGTVHDNINLRGLYNTGKSGYFAPGTPNDVNKILLRESRSKSGKIVPSRVRKNAEKGVISNHLMESEEKQRSQLMNSMLSKYKRKNI